MTMAVVSCVSLASCSKDIIDEEEAGAVDDVAVSPTKHKGTGKLVVRAKAAADGTSEAKVSYPVYVYVFDSGAACVETAVIESGESTLNVTLSEGKYTVCAVGGATADAYDVPTKENATMASVVALKTGKGHGDLMTAKSAVTLSRGEVNTLTLAMERKVMLLQDVTISNVPEKVTNVAIEIAPVYEKLQIDGEYIGESGKHTVTLVKQDNDGTWKNSEPSYLLETLPEATVKVQMTDAEGTKSYSYALNGELQANYMISIAGTYTGADGIVLTGTITGAVWAGERVITFDFDDEGSDIGSGNTGDNPSDGQVIEGTAPAAGSMYNGCYVFSAKKQSDGSSTVTLLAPKSKTGFSLTSAAELPLISSEIEAAIEELAVDGISGWRLPTLTELKVAIDDNSRINSAVGSQYLSQYRSYFYETSDGKLDAYCKLDEVEYNSGAYMIIFSTVTFR